MKYKLVVGVLLALAAALGLGYWLWRGAENRIDADQPHTGRVTAMAVSNDGEWLVTGSEDGTVIVREARSGRVVRTLAHPGMVFDAAFAADRSRLVTVSVGGTNPQVALWDLSTGQEVWKERGEFSACRVSPDGAWVVAAHMVLPKVMVFAGATGQVARAVTLPEDVAKCKAVEVSPDGRVAALRVEVKAQDFLIHDAYLLELPGGDPRKLPDCYFTMSVRFAAAGRTLTGLRPQVVQVWNLPAGTVAGSRPHQFRGTGGLLTPDGRRVVALDDDREHVIVWDVDAGQVVWQRQFGSRMVNAKCLSPDGRMLYVSTAQREKLPPDPDPRKRPPADPMVTAWQLPD
jgi:WD40 repeat protein